MNKSVILLLALCMTATSIAFGAKYTVNSHGTVKSPSGSVITSPANSINQTYFQPSGNVIPALNSTFTPINTTVNQGVNSVGVNGVNNVGVNAFSSPTGTTQIIENYFNNYQAQAYVNSNQVNSTQVGIIEFVMDYSGSMSNWIETAKRSMSAILAQISNTTKVGFRVFGHDNNGSNPTTISTVKDIKKIVKEGNKFKIVTEKGCLGSTRGACSATQQVAPITPINISNLVAGMNSVNLGGATPLVYALDRTAYQDFSTFDTVTPKKIILITDGGENCGGDPCAFAKKLMQKRSDIHIDVVLVSSNSRALSCLASTTGGHFYNVNNLENFSTVVNQSMLAQPTIQQNSQEQKYEYISE